MIFHRYSGCRKVKNMGTGVENGIGQLRKGGKGIGRFAVALIVAYVITVLALFGIAFVMLKLQPDAGTTELLILGVYALSMFCRRLVRGKTGRKTEVPSGTVGGNSVFCPSVSDFRNGRAGDSV